MQFELKNDNDLALNNRHKSSKLAQHIFYTNQESNYNSPFLEITVHLPPHDYSSDSKCSAQKAAYNQLSFSSFFYL
jgi:hypothetical protein